MQVIQQGQQWVIAKNFQHIGGEGISGSRSHSAERVREIYDCWTGERWWGQRSAAKVFPTAEEAQLYLDENRDRLSDAPEHAV